MPPCSCAATRSRRAWQWVEPILEAWGASEEGPKPYLAGSWGPTAAIALIERDGRTWLEEPH